MTLSNTTIAILHRVVMTMHICPLRKSLDLLRRDSDHHLTTRATVDALKDRHDVGTTPQTLIDGQRIAGDDDLRPRFSKTVRDSTATPYRAVRDGDGKPMGRVRMRPDAVSGHGSARCEPHHA